MLSYINDIKLKQINKITDSILLVYENENQLFYMMKVQLSKIEKLYKNQFGYYIIHKKYIENVLKRKISTFPQVVIMNKEHVVAFIRGFRQINEVIKTIEFNFRLSLCHSINKA